MLHFCRTHHLAVEVQILRMLGLCLETKGRTAPLLHRRPLPTPWPACTHTTTTNASRLFCSLYFILYY